MPVIISTADAALGPFCPRHRVRVVEADQPPIAGIVHGERVFDSVRALWSGGYSPDRKLHPISGSFIDDVDVSVKVKQVLERVVLPGAVPSHPKMLSKDDN